MFKIEKLTPDTLLEYPDSWPLLVLLGSMDGARGQHAISIYNNMIFDANAPFALQKCQESLDWAAGNATVCYTIVRCY